MTTNGHSQCTRDVTFDCEKETVYWKVVVARNYEESQDPLWTLNDTEAISGFVTSSLVLRNLGIDWIKPRVFSKLSSTLRELDLSFNNMKTLHQHALFSAMRLRIIYLAYNELREILSSAIKKCFRLLKLYFKPVQTQGTQLLKLFIQLYYTNSHQQYENKVSHSLMFTISMFTNQHVNQYSHNRHKNAKRHK